MMVSVVIPVYNGARFLGEAIESCLAQDRAPDEVVVVDDASTDGSAEVARSFDGVRVVEQAENLGPSAARNRGAAIAQGSVLAFHDADDVMTQGRISRQVLDLVKHPEIDVLLGRQRILIAADQEVPYWAIAEHGHNGVLGVPFCSVTVRHAAFERIGGFDPSYRASEDLDLLFRCRAAGIVIAARDHVIVERRVHADNTMNHAVPSGETRRALFRSLGSIARDRRASPAGGSDA